MPPPLSERAFARQMKGVAASAETVAEEELAESATRLRQLMMEEDPSITADTIVDVAVTYDGTR